MHKKSWAMMKVLLNRFHKGSTDALQNCLPLEEVQIVLGLDIGSQDTKAALIQPKDFFNHIHYSWLPPAVQQFAPAIQSYVVSTLEQRQADRLAQLLHIKKPPQPQSDVVRSFLLQRLYQCFDKGDVLPREYISQGPLMELLDFDKDELVNVIVYLGLYDLSEKIRHIVDKKRLRDLYRCMTPDMQQFLTVCLHQKEKVTAPGLSIDKWPGDKDSLLRLLHQRGLLRLGKALAGQNPDFLWHVVHTLDTGRGNILMKYFAREEVPRVTQLLIQQVLNLLNFMKKKSVP